jgi:radical SAM superfamily enzyme YgiQ (UPF0313 family)
MENKRILLVSPKIFKGRHRLALHPQVGLGYLSETLIRNNFVVEVCDMNLQYGRRRLFKRIFDFSPAVIGFSLMSFGYQEAYNLINSVKERFPSPKIAAGGPHVSIFRQKVLRDCKGVDYGFILEAEKSFLDFCEGKDVKTIGGIIYRKNSQIFYNDPGNFNYELDDIDFPRYSSFQLKNYPTKQIGIATSRGCPYDCIFCPVGSAIGKKFRQRSPENVVEEIAYWYANNYRDIYILDDNFTLDQNRIRAICEALIKKNFAGIHLKCPNGIRADRVDYELLKLMRSAGFDMLAFGVEAASDRILKILKKHESLSTIEKGIKNACDLGFDVDLFFILGSPGETFRDLRASFALPLRYPVRNAKFYNIVPFPTTELYEWLKKNNYLLYDMEEILSSASHFANRPYFFTPELSIKERKKAFKTGMEVTRIVRRKYIEKKITGLPILLRRVISWFYSLPAVCDIFLNVTFLLKLKDILKIRVIVQRP